MYHIYGIVFEQEAEHSGDGATSLLRVLSDLREAMWAYVQIGISTLDVDFHAYGMKHLSRFLQNAKSTELQNWLKVVEA